MIYYPIRTLVTAGIKDIMIVVSGPHSGDFISILKNGEDLGCNICYGYQEKPDGGIADALGICRKFAGHDPICVILGDNTTDANISEPVKEFDETVHHLYYRIEEQTEEPKPIARVFLKEVQDPNRFGVAEIDGPFVTRIEEKPEHPQTDLAVTGVYLYDQAVFYFIDECSPSQRGELEITDVNNLYIKHGFLSHHILEGFWKDAGTFEALLEAGQYWKSKGGYHKS
jgi:glucose-1-phosphate thymidylyltransferase